MALTTGTGLTNVSDVCEAFRTHLLADGWTSVINAGSVGSNNKEVWMTKNAVDTFYNQYPITVGFRARSSDELDITVAPHTPTEMLITPPGSPATRNTFLRTITCPSRGWSTTSPFLPGNSGDVYPSGFVSTTSGDHHPCRVDAFNQGANYLSHWIFSPNQSPLNAGPIYCYMTVEVATGLYRTFGFGEGIKLGASGWTGGLFVDGTNVRSGQTTRSRYFTSGSVQFNSFNHEGEDGYVLNYNNDSYLNTNLSPLTWNPWMYIGGFTLTDGVSAVGMGDYTPGLGRPFIDRGTANFSGQTIRVPARLYATNVRDGAGDNRMRPLIEFPDVFHMNIGNFNPGDTLTDDAEKFLVVPYSAKTGTDNTGNRGILIRHPDL